MKDDFSHNTQWVIISALLMVISGCVGGMTIFSSTAQGVRGETPTATIDDISLSPAPLHENNWLDDSLLGYWTFDEGEGTTAHDWSNNKNHGTLHGADWFEGKYGESAKFDGEDDYIELGTPLPDSTHLTIAVWVRYYGYDNTGTIFMDGTADADNDLVYDMDRSGVGIRADKSGAGINYEGALLNTGLSLHQVWKQIVWVMTPTQSRIYVDGELDNTIDETGSNQGHHSQNPSIGRWFDGDQGKHFFHGFMDELGIWSRELNGSEIKDHFNGNFRDPIRFSGSGSDDGSITQYAWRSSIDGEFYNGSESNIRYTGLSAGDHTITLRVMDNEGQWSDGAIETLFVGERPLAEIVGIYNAEWEYDLITYAGGGEPKGSLERYSWSSDTYGEFYNDSSDNITFDGLGGDLHIITLKVMNSDGIWSWPVHETIYLDWFEVFDDLSYVEICNPVNNDEIEGDYSIGGEAYSDFGTIVLVQVQIANGSWENATGTEEWYWVWNSRTTDDGTVNIRAKATDSSGNTFEDEITVTIANDGNDDGGVEITFCFVILVILLLVILVVLLMTGKIKIQLVGGQNTNEPDEKDRREGKAQLVLPNFMKNKTEGPDENKDVTKEKEEEVNGGSSENKND